MLSAGKASADPPAGGKAQPGQATDHSPSDRGSPAFCHGRLHELVRVGRNYAEGFQRSLGQLVFPVLRDAVKGKQFVAFERHYPRSGDLIFFSSAVGTFHSQKNSTGISRRRRLKV
jgi:hypothetical protein